MYIYMGIPPHVDPGFDLHWKKIGSGVFPSAYNNAQEILTHISPQSPKQQGQIAGEKWRKQKKKQTCDTRSSRAPYLSLFYVHPQNLWAHVPSRLLSL